MITMTEFIEKVDAIMGQKNMDDKKANQLCHLYAMIFKNGYNACVEETAVWLKAMLWKKPKTRQEELVQAALEEYPEWEEAQCHFIDGAHYADSHPHWISVEDELPKINPNDSEWEYSDDVIVALKDGSIAVGRYERDNSTGEHYWILYGVGKYFVVSHWMPLPQAPILANFAKTCKNLKGGEE